MNVITFSPFIFLSCWYFSFVKGLGVTCRYLNLYIFFLLFYYISNSIHLCHSVNFLSFFIIYFREALEISSGIPKNTKEVANPIDPPLLETSCTSDNSRLETTSNIRAPPCSLKKVRHFKQSHFFNYLLLWTSNMTEFF